MNLPDDWRNRLTFRVSTTGAVTTALDADGKALLYIVPHNGNRFAWLHVRGMQGAHVVVPGAGPAPDARTLGDAALLAAHFSSARGEDGVEVDRFHLPVGQHLHQRAAGKLRPAVPKAC